QVVDRHRKRQHVALAPTHAEALQDRQLLRRLDALSNERRSDLVCERDQGRRQCPADGVVVDAVGEGQVELDDVGAQSEDVTEAGEARAGVIDRQPRTAGSYRYERIREAAVVTDGR